MFYLKTKCQKEMKREFANADHKHLEDPLPAKIMKANHYTNL